jgi:hypothetical protein
MGMTATMGKELDIAGKDWLTVEEAAHYCGVSKSQFAACAPDYGLVARRFMGKKLFERAALYAAIAKAPSWDGTPSTASVPGASPLARCRNLTATRLRPYKPRKKAED